MLAGLVAVLTGLVTVLAAAGLVTAALVLLIPLVTGFVAAVVLAAATGFVVTVDAFEVAVVTGALAVDFADEEAPCETDRFAGFVAALPATVADVAFAGTVLLRAIPPILVLLIAV